MPDLLNEMRKDIKEFPLAREFVILSKGWIFNPSGPVLMYYLEDHAELENKLRILQNCDLISDITRTDTKRYLMSEELARYLGCL